MIPVWLRYTLMFSVAMVCVVACGKQATNVNIAKQNSDHIVPDKLTPDVAKIAIATMFGPPIAADIMEREVVIGTCIPTPAKYAEHKGQISCGFLIKNGAGSSESKADFYRTPEAWVAMPSSTDEELPFPDPKLQ